ncbi:MAG: hypothetical protein AAGM22_19370 [Acidobacteriota bacterium]
MSDREMAEISAALDTMTTRRDWREACAAVAAAALQRPESPLLSERLDGWLATLLNHPEADEQSSSALIEGLAARGQLGELGTSAVWEATQNPGPESGHDSGDRAIAMAARYAAWCPQRLTWTDLGRLADRAQGVFRGDAFLTEVVERWLWRYPDLASQGAGPAIVKLESTLGAHPRWPWTRELIRRRLGMTINAEHSPVPRFGPALGPPARLAVVQNLDIGQGDEILRLGPWLAILLGLWPDVRCEVITRRRHLWDHPRIQPISIDDQSAVRASLDAADGLAWTDEPLTPEIRLVDWLPTELRRRSRSASWVFEMVTRNCQPVFRQLRIDGVDRLSELKPDLPPRHAYDTLQRLALQLGAPWIGAAASEPEGGAETGSPFIGRGSAECDAAVARLRGGPSRPLAVVQPFGGFAEVKGYTRSDGGRLLLELEALVGEGFEVVLMPTFEPWGTAAVVRRLIDRLAPHVARHVRAAADPADPPAWLEERAELRPQDRVMRLYKFLIARADLVVAVEGWVCHLASLLGRPVRMVLWAGSFSPDWYPRDATWAAGLSPGCPPRSADLSGAAAPPVLCLTDRGLLDLALGAGLPGDSLELLVPRLFASQDPETRAMALRAATPRLDSPRLTDVATRGLADRAAAVRFAAATGWLGRPDLLGRWPASPQTLEAHRWIASEAWARVVPLGLAALPALAVAAKGERDFTRRQAQRLLESILRNRAAGRSDGVDSPPAAP